MIEKPTYRPITGVFAKSAAEGNYHLAEVHRLDGPEPTYRSICGEPVDPFVPLDVMTKYDELPGKDICEGCANISHWLIER